MIMEESLDPEIAELAELEMGSEASSSQPKEIRVLDTFFGVRKPAEKVAVSKNAYEYIEQWGLDNISGLPAIPDNYFRSVLLYAVHISGAMAHAHKHGLVHGNFNLSKILVQNLEDLPAEYLKFDYNFGRLNFFVTNFEPYQVFRYIQIYNEDEPLYRKLFQSREMKIDVKSMTQMVKVMDLHAFANSIIEFMVGKCTHAEQTVEQRRRKKINLLNLLNV
jgi:hypothetical protein